MANEAVIVELLGDPKGMPVSYEISGVTAIEKGTFLKFVDPRYASASAGIGDVFAGFAATEKVAGDTSTHIGAWTCGIFDLVDGSATVAGQFVSISGVNMVRTATATDLISGCVVGKALETATVGETIQVAVGIY